MKTWGGLPMWQTWYQSPLPFAISEGKHPPPSQVDYILFYKKSDRRVQWLLAAGNEKF
jgi:hypothetical protein